MAPVNALGGRPAASSGRAKENFCSRASFRAKAEVGRCHRIEARIFLFLFARVPRPDHGSVRKETDRDIESAGTDGARAEEGPASRRAWGARRSSPWVRRPPRHSSLFWYLFDHHDADRSQEAGGLGIPWESVAPVRRMNSDGLEGESDDRPEQNSCACRRRRRGWPRRKPRAQGRSARPGARPILDGTCPRGSRARSRRPWRIVSRLWRRHRRRRSRRR